MAGLKVTTAKSGSISTKNSKNYGQQGSTQYQQSKPVTIQAKPSTPQAKPGYQQSRPVNVQAQPTGPTPQQIAQAAAAAARAAQEAAAARRQQVQATINTKVQQQQQRLTAAVAQPTFRTQVNVPQKPMRTGQIVVPDNRTEFEKMRDEAYKRAIAAIDKQRDGGDKKGLSKLWDKVTFGQDRRDAAVRGYAEKELQKLQKESISKYEKRLTSFLGEQAKRRQQIEGTKFLSRQAYDRAVADYESWEKSAIAGLEGDRARLTGAALAYNQGSKAPLTSTTAKAFGAFSKATQPVQNALGAVWKYTLGSGDKNVPSLATAPSRLVNWIGNINTKDRDIYISGGKKINRANSNLNAWQATLGQRNLNLRPWTEKKFDPAQARKILLDGNLAALEKTRGRKFSDKELEQMWATYNKRQKGLNSVTEFFADPLLAFGGAAKAGTKLAAPKVASWLKPVTSQVSRLTESKLGAWLNAEAKSPSQKLFDAVLDAKNVQGEVQKKLLPRINALNTKLVGRVRLDTGVIADIEKLTDDEAKVLQRMVNGKFTVRDSFRLRGKGNVPIRANLQDIARRWTDFSEQLRLADQVERTRFGAGKKLYSPRTAWIYKGKKGYSLDDYNFRLRKRVKGEQTAQDFYQGIVDRYFKSNLDESFAAEQSAKRGRRVAERDQLVRQYDEMVNPAREAVQKAYAKTRTPYGRARGVIDRFGPTALWKKSVLKYRPAWYVNNFLYNTQAAGLAGGSRALVEQARLLRPRNFRAALAEVPDDVRTKLASEIGRGRLAKFGNNVENLSRVAAFRALKRQGLSDADALKRVNRYLLDYSTKNWERPIKAVVPFWSWQKGLTKAAVNLPFDRPLAAKGYNKVDEYQRKQFDDEFDALVPNLKRLGYSDAEINELRKQNAKYFRGRLRLPGSMGYITTPFNAFSEKGLSSFGVNPFLSALGETALSRDSFGTEIKGTKSTLFRRFAGKFPQADLALNAKSRWHDPKQISAWIGQPGSEGYGLPKSAQGADSKKPNYQRALDPGAKFWQDLAAFAGVPRSLKFDTKQLLERATMRKVKDAYFGVNWKEVQEKEGYEAVQKQQAAIFKKFGITADDFYKGELAKYDTATTKKIKAQKEEARKKTNELYAEYQRQPKGTRNVWATNKLKELVDSGYFANNPFLRSFDWTNPDTIAKAYKKMAFDQAKASGNFSAYNAKYGVSPKYQKFLDYQAAKKSGDWSAFQRKYGTSPKAAKKLAYDEAVRTGNWNAYHAKYGVSTNAQKKIDYDKAKASGDWSAYNAKYGMSEKAKDAQFWERYAYASKSERKQLLAENPRYNTRADWSEQQWNVWREQNRQEKRIKARSLAGFSGNERAFKEIEQALAFPINLKKQRTKVAKIKFA